MWGIILQSYYLFRRYTSSVWILQSLFVPNNIGLSLCKRENSYVIDIIEQYILRITNQKIKFGMMSVIISNPTFLKNEWLRFYFSNEFKDKLPRYLTCYLKVWATVVLLFHREMCGSFFSFVVTLHLYLTIWKNAPIYQFRECCC